MTSLIESQLPPIHLYASRYKEKHGDDYLYACHPLNVAANLELLSDFGVDPARVIEITDNTYLNRELSSDQKSICIFGGGYTYSLSSELNSVRSALQTAVNNGKVNVFGQCAGSYMLCEEILTPQSRSSTRNRQNLNPLGLLPIVANANVYPIIKGQPNGDFVNRRVAQLANNRNETFGCFWYRGPQFNYSEKLAKESSVTLTTIATYNDIDGAKPIAAVRGVHPNGSVVIACGAHPEFLKEEVPGQTNLEQRLRKDTVRLAFVEDIFKSINVIPSQTVPSQACIGS